MKLNKSLAAAALAGLFAAGAANANTQQQSDDNGTAITGEKDSCNGEKDKCNGKKDKDSCNGEKDKCNGKDGCPAKDGEGEIL